MLKWFCEVWPVALMRVMLTVLLLLFVGVCGFWAYKWFKKQPERSAVDAVVRALFVVGMGLFATVTMAQKRAILQVKAEQAEERRLCGEILVGGIPSRREQTPPRSSGMRTIDRWQYGVYEDGEEIKFEGDWRFPYGTGHLSSVEVMAWGDVLPDGFSRDKVATLGRRVSFAREQASFTYGLTPSNSYVFVWTGTRDGRIDGVPFEGRIELFRNGDIAVTTNGVTMLTPRELPFEHDGYGQDGEWVAANFTNATEIAAAGGYAAWVDEQVGEGLTNGLYKFTAAFPEVPLEATQLVVGDLSLVVTNAGSYVFLLEKGVSYDFGTIPFSPEVVYSAVDDVPRTRGGLRSSVMYQGPGFWSISGGCDIYEQTIFEFGNIIWMPLFCGSPNLSYIGLESGTMVFTANLSDYRGVSPVTYEWSAPEGMSIASPNAQTTEVEIESMPSWAQAEISVTASFGGHSLVSFLDFVYGTNETPQVFCSLSVQGTHFINEGNRPERIYPVSVSLICPVDTNGVVDISHDGSDGALFWSDAAATQPLQSLTGIPVSSVGEGSGTASYTFYMTSPNVGGGSLTALFTLPSGDTRGVAKMYGAIEPIRKLVCNEIDSQYSCVFNPSRLVYGHPARLKVDANGNFSPDQVEWRVVSGPATVARTEDEFGDADWTATVTATADSGEVVVEARFNEDAIQPRFVLPIVQQRTLPVKAFVVGPSKDPVFSESEIQSMICYANIIFSQIGVELSLLSISNDVGSASDLVLSKMQTYTNANGRTYRALSSQTTSLLNTYTCGDCLELYFVEKIVNEHTVAFSCDKGIVVSKEATTHSVAHEIGHSLGLKDCFSRRNGNAVQIASGNEPVTSAFFVDKGKDWGTESGRGFYAADDTVSVVLPRMLMFGEDSSNDSIDIPSGAVYSLMKSASSPLQTVSASVGAEFVKTNIVEVFSK